MHNQHSAVIGTSPRQSKNPKTMLPQGASSTTSIPHSSTGKKTAGSFKNDDNQPTSQLVLGSNNLIISRGRPNPIENRASATMLNTGPMNYSKTLTQHVQNQHQVSGSGYHSGKTKGLSKRTNGTSTTQLNSKKTSLHNRNGSSILQTQHTGVVSTSATPARTHDTLSSKVKKKKRTLANTSSFQHQSNQNSNSRGNLLIQHNHQLSYLKQSQQLQEARNNRDSVGQKKSVKSTASMKKPGSGHAQQAGAQSHVINHQNLLASQTQLNIPTSLNKLGATVVSDSSFNNMTIRSGDKYNSTLGAVKRQTVHHKQRQINNLEQQVLSSAQMQQLAHPMSAKNTTENKKNIFQAGSTHNLNATYKTGNQVAVGASKHYLNGGGGSMVELSTGTKAVTGSSKPHTTNLNSASAFQRSHHQIYHSKNQSIGGVSYSSNNSRFTTTRPKNPTDGSVSSKGSIDSAPSHFGVSTNNRLKQKLSQQQNQQALQQQQQTANVQSVSLQIDPDYLTNKSISPQKGQLQVNQVQYASGSNKVSTTNSSKFNLVNRGVLNAGQLPAVVSGVSHRGGVLSPKSSGGRVINQSMSTQQMVFKATAGSSNVVSGKASNDFQQHQQQVTGSTTTVNQQKQRKLSMAKQLSHQQLLPSAQSQEVLQTQPVLNSAAQSSQQPNAGSEITEARNHELAKEQSLSTGTSHLEVVSVSNASHQQMQIIQKQQKGHQAPPPQPVISIVSNIQAQDLNVNKSSKKLTHEVINEEQVEESANATKRQSLENPTVQPNIGGANVGNAHVIGGKAGSTASNGQVIKSTMASASAPNLSQSVQNTTKVKTVNLSKDTPVSKQLTSLRQQLKSQIVKQTSSQPARSQNSEPVVHQTNSMRGGGCEANSKGSSLYNSNPQQPSSAIGVNEAHFPMPSRQALQLFRNAGLTDYEKIEIQNYQEVYFLGLESTKIQASSLLGHNFGFDDDRGDYQVSMKDHLAYRFEVLDKLGSGSFGQAVKCFDHKKQMMVAIKVIRNKKRFQHQAGVELRLLRYLKQKDRNDENNIVRVLDYAIFRKHLLLSFELLSMNLYEFIKQNNFQGVSTGLIRRFAIQILQALKFQRDQDIIHCDLKPENILLKQPNKSGIKIIDYGSSCFSNQRIYTYIQSRFYRAPEIVLGIPYTTSIDMWSFGCIMAELYTGYPLFPGENEAEQLAYIMEIKGIPPDYIVELSSRRNMFFEKDSFVPIVVTNSRGRRRLPNTKTLHSVLKKCQDAKFLDFINQCLDWDPVNRMTPLEALQHEWILEGLPDKVLVHHQRMFGGKDDKINLKEASLTAVQGFPEEANSKTIYDIVAELRAEDQKKDLRAQKTFSQERVESKDVGKVSTATHPGIKDTKGCESVPAKTPNRSEYQTNKPQTKTTSRSNKKSIIIQAPSVKPEGTGSSVADDTNTEKAFTESPSKHRKILRNFQQSKSTKALAPNNVQLEKVMKPMVNNMTMTVLTEVSEQKKHRDLVAVVDKGSAASKVIKNLTVNQNSTTTQQNQSYERSAKTIGKTTRGHKLMNFDNNQSHDSGAFTETATEAQDHAKSPSDQQHCDELTRMKKKALIFKTQSQVPLQTTIQLIQDVVVEDASAYEKHGATNRRHQSTTGPAPAQKAESISKMADKILRQDSLDQNRTGEEDDYEDMVTPTDDEGITSLNHTQKIPISLIKAKDKASKLFQAIPNHTQVAGYHNSHHTAGSGTHNDGSHNINYYQTNYGSVGGLHTKSSSTGSQGLVTSVSQGKKRVQTMKASNQNSAMSLTSQQAMILAAMHQKGSGKLQLPTGSSSHGSDRGSTTSKVLASQNRNENLSLQQTKYQLAKAATSHNPATTRSQSNKKEESKLSHIQNQHVQHTGPSSQTYRAAQKEPTKVIMASISAAQLAAKKHTSSGGGAFGYQRSK